MFISYNQRGYSMVELIAVMVIAGVLAAVAIPRFFDTNVYQTRGFNDQVVSSLRYAQSIAIAQNVCAGVAITSSRLTFNTYSYSSTNGCGSTATPLNLPSGTTNVLYAPSNITIGTSPALSSFSFDPLGRPVVFSTQQQKITVTGDGSYTFIIENGTGYVHSS